MTPQRGPERAWVLAIARNLLTDHYRRQRHRDTVSTDEHPLLLDALSSDDWVERRLTHAELQAGSSSSASASGRSWRCATARTCRRPRSPS